MDINAYRPTRYIAAERPETAFAALLRLYQVRPAFRGLLDFFIIGIIILPFLGIGNFGVISSAKSWAVDKAVGLSFSATMSSIMPEQPAIAPIPRIDEIPIDRTVFTSSSAANRRALDTAATLHEAGETGKALNTIRGLERDINVDFMKGLLTLGLTGHGNTKHGQAKLLAAADLGHRQATTLAGILYMLPPPGGEQDYNKAINLLELAISQGDGYAAFMLARSYVGGWTGTIDIARAVDLYKKGAELGHADSAFEYAGHLFIGRGIEENRDEAERWLETAADLGHAQSQSTLGNLYMIKWGLGTVTNPEVALERLRQAARQDETEAMLSLGLYYWQLAERIGKAEPARGADWFERCAKLGHPGCRYRLAEAYQTGHGRQLDASTAYAQFNLAEAGYRKMDQKGGANAAFEAANALKSRLNGAEMDRAEDIITSATQVNQKSVQ